MSGEPGEVIEHYLASVLAATGSHAVLEGHLDRTGSGQVRFREITVANPEGAIAQPATGAPLDVRLEYDLQEDVALVDPVFWFRIRSSEGGRLLFFSTSLIEHKLGDVTRSGAIICRIPRLPLIEGHYLIDVGVSVNRGCADRIQAALEFAVGQGDFFGTHQYVTDSPVVCGHAWRSS